MIPRDTRTALQPVRYGGIPYRTATFRRHNTTLLIGVKSSEAGPQTDECHFNVRGDFEGVCRLRGRDHRMVALATVPVS